MNEIIISDFKSTQQIIQSHQIIHVLSPEINQHRCNESIEGQKKNNLEPTINFKDLEDKGLIWSNGNQANKYMLLKLTDEKCRIDLPESVKIINFAQMFHLFQKEFRIQQNKTTQPLSKTLENLQKCQKRLKNLQYMATTIKPSIEKDKCCQKLQNKRNSSPMQNFRHKLRKLTSCNQIITPDKKINVHQNYLKAQNKQFKIQIYNERNQKQEIDEYFQKDLNSTKTPKVQKTIEFPHQDVERLNNYNENRLSIFDRSDSQNSRRYAYSPISPIVKRNKKTRILYVRR